MSSPFSLRPWPGLASVIFGSTQHQRKFLWETSDLSLPVPPWEHWLSCLKKNYCFGTVFLNKDKKEQQKAKETLLFQLRKQGLIVEGWRKVPIDKKVCGKEVLKNIPDIEQIIITADDKIIENDFEKKLYVARIQSEKILVHDEVF